MKGYNLPDNVSLSDPEAPWNKDDESTGFICEDCGKSITEETGVGLEDGLVCIPCAIERNKEETS